MAQSGVRADSKGCQCLTLLVLMGDLAMGVRNELLFGKHLLSEEKLVHKLMAFHGLPEETCSKVL